MQGIFQRRPAPRRWPALLLVGAVAALAAVGGYPPLGVAPAATVTTEVTAVADAYVRSDSPSSRYGTLSELWADASPTARTYLRFQVSNVSGPVTKATLRVRANASHSTGFQVRRVTSTTWSESTITYSNAPTVSSTVSASSGALTAGTWRDVDVTSLISGNGTYSLGLTTTSTANLVLASRETGANAPRLVIESNDTTAPQTTLSSGPSGTVGSTSASFGFTSSETGSTFQCSLDSTSAYTACTSPKDYTGLAAGSHTFRVRAIDRAGNVDTTPASRTWTVQDTTPPDTTISSGPTGTVPETNASFAFTSTEAGSTFQCSLDTGAYGACTSPKAYSGLAAGSHTFRVRAIDAAGNIDGTPAARTWTIEARDTTPPDTSISSGPTGTYRSATADFAVGATEAGSTFECRLDGGAFGACGATPTFHVANGRHQLEVRAVDAAGNADASPATRTWWADATLQNGNFETPLAGWTTQGGGYVVPAWKPGSGALSLVSGGNTGPQAGRLTATADGSLSVSASPWPVNSAVAGTIYTARGWVRSETPGKDVCLRLREYDGSTLVGSAQTCVTTTGAWRAFNALQYTVAQSGTELNLLVYQVGTATASESFDLDGMSLTDGSPAQVPPVPADSGDPTLLAASDVASCWSSGDESVSRLLDTLPGTIAIPGDTEQNHGYPEEFTGCYDPSWGRHKSRTKPAVGDHEYSTPGATGYFDYFGSAAGAAGKGWYSYDLGAWHIVVLNSNCAQVGGCGPGSEQYGWLQQDLAANAGNCIGAYWHHPRWSAGTTHGSLTNSAPFWELLYQYRAEWVLGGNDHTYQRFAPQRPDGTLDRERGMRQFVVGEGGTMHYPLGPPLANTEAQNTGAFGVLRMTLHAGSYDWRFISQEGKAFSDSGSTDCSPLATPEPPDTTIDSGPAASTDATTASFAFSATKPGASFECSLDGAAFADCSSPKEYTGVSVGDHSFRVRAVNADGTDQSPATHSWTVTAPPPVLPNLLPNGGFETAKSGWYAYRSTLTLVPGGAEGSQAGRVALNSSTATSYSLLTDPHPVGTHSAGTRYEARAWIRSDRPGKTVCLRLREWSTGAAVGGAERCRVATGTWERLDAVPYTAVGGDSIELYAYQSSAAAGDSFDIDGITLTAP